jgi:YVTN family beta-propeller protein
MALRRCNVLENPLQVCLGGVVEFAILGALEVRAGGRVVNLGGPKQRLALAVLLLHANSAVSRDRLIDGIWGERAPHTAARTLDSYVSRLRMIVGADRIVRRPAGYVLSVEPGELDLDRFEELVNLGRDALAVRPDRAAELLVEALALWRGPALADLRDEPAIAREASRLDERRLIALETRMEAELARGRGADLAPDLDRLVAENPYRERLLAQLMIALYRGGRQSDALAAYGAGRRRFAEELGLEPSPNLRELERRILEHDPDLAGKRFVTGGRGRLKIVAAATAVTLAGVAAVVILELSGSGGKIIELTPGGTAGIDATPASMAADATAVWLVEPDAGAVIRVNRKTRRVEQRIAVGGSPAAIAVGGGAVWAASIPGDSVIRIDPATGAQTQAIHLGGAQVGALAYGRGTVWVADTSDRELIGIDAQTGTVRKTFELLVKPSVLAFGRSAIWVADYEAGTLTELDARTGATVMNTPVGNGPAAIGVGAGAVWVANSLDSTVSRVDPSTGAVLATIPVGSFPVALAIDGESVWVGNEYSSSVSRIPARGSAVADSIRVAGGPTAIVAASGRLWVGSRSVAQRTGGTLRLVKSAAFSIDPAVNLDLGPLQADGLTRDGLVAYNLASGAQGTALVPDLALAVPLPSDGGLTYTFRLRPGIRYSNGDPVRATDFRRAFERLFRLKSPGRDFYSGIRGAAACRPSRCDLSQGVETDDEVGMVSFHLLAPDPGFLQRLTTGGLSSPVPAGTPWHESRTPIPGTGPYRIEQASHKQIRYVRNPYFHEWSHAAQPSGNPDVIVMRFGLTPSQEVRAVERNEADWSADGIPANLLGEVTTRFRSRLHSNAGSETDFLQFNTRIPPFNDVRVRRALNFAIDRNVVVRLFGGPAVASATCQILPPGVFGFRRYCPYTRHPRRKLWTNPDLAMARRLVAASNTRGAAVTIWGTPNSPAVQHRVLPYVLAILRRLGYSARAHIVPGTFFQTAKPSVFRTIQMTPPAWADVTPYNFFGPWFSCDSSFNHRWFCSARIDRDVRRAQALEAVDPRAASALWAEVDKFATDSAAWVPLVNPRAIDFLSARILNYQHHPVLGIIADQLVVG